VVIVDVTSASAAIKRPLMSAPTLLDPGRAAELLPSRTMLRAASLGEYNAGVTGAWRFGFAAAKAAHSVCALMECGEKLSKNAISNINKIAR
jgi:hypothetical protein